MNPLGFLQSLNELAREKEEGRRRRKRKREREEEGRRKSRARVAGTAGTSAAREVGRRKPA